MKSVLLWVFPIFIFLVFRLLFLTSLPIVNDESIYLHWGNDFLRLWSNPTMPLSLQGKQALTAITLGLVQKIPIDPLIAGRLTTIIFSLITLVATAWIGQQVLSKKATHVALLLLSTSPLLIFFDRLALPDSIVTASYTMALALTLSLLHKPTIVKSLALGFTIALGWWYKSTALLAIPAVILSAIFYLLFWKNVIKISHRILLLTCVSIIAALSLSVGLIHLPILNRVVPLSQTEHVFTLQQLLLFPWSNWLSNIWKTLQALIIISSPLAILFIIFSPATAGLKIRSGVWVVFLWFVIPIAIEILLAQIFNVRYIILTIPAFVILLSSLIEKRVRWKTTLSWAMIASSGLLSLILITTPLTFYTLLTPIPTIQKDILQYVSGWSSGWGVQEASVFLQKEVASFPAIIFVRNDSGNPEDGIYVYLSKTKNINVIPISYMNQIIANTKHIPNISYYFVSRGTQMAGLETRATLRIRYAKPFGDEFIGIYQIIPQ